jgi:hypothetical protein
VVGGAYGPVDAYGQRAECSHRTAFARVDGAWRRAACGVLSRWHSARWSCDDPICGI